MRKLMLSMAALPLLVGSLSVNASAAEGISILDNIKLTGEIRPRYEYAEVKDNGREAANAFTARTKLVASATLFGIDGLTADVGIISVNNFGWHEYNAADGKGYTTSDGKIYDVIKDPQYAMISNADINYKTGNTLLHVGRSKVNLDNQRFIGTVGWRQLERSYDSVFVANNSVENLSLLAAWVYGFQGVGAGETTDTNSILLHGSYKVSDPLTVTAYGYLLANLEDTYGIALTGKADVGVKVSYRAEYAIQTDNTMKMHGADKNKVDGSYFNLDISTNISGVILGANYEFLSGDKTSTPNKRESFVPHLGTNHKFNGWADEFYVAHNPSGGLKDANIRIGYKAKGFGKLLGVYHDFKADTAMAAASGTTDDLGSEIDVVYVNAIPGVKNLKGLVKYASYSKGKATEFTYNKDKQVAWVQLDYKFSTK